jgi:hypothetical protein
MITYHPEQTNDVEHIVELCNLFTDTETMQVVTITCLPAFFDSAVNAYNKIKAECSVMLNLSQINDDTGMSKYTPEQQRKLQSLTFSKSFNMKEKKANTIPVEDMYHNGMVRYTYPDGTTRSDFAVNFIKRGEDNFYGMSCHAGMDFVRIEWDSIRRAVCPVGERWTIFDEKIFAQEPVKCTINSCNCSIDLMTPKYSLHK